MWKIWRSGLVFHFEVCGSTMTSPQVFMALRRQATSYEMIAANFETLFCSRSKVIDPDQCSDAHKINWLRSVPTESGSKQTLEAHCSERVAILPRSLDINTETKPAGGGPEPTHTSSSTKDTMYSTPSLVLLLLFHPFPLP